MEQNCANLLLCSQNDLWRKIWPFGLMLNFHNFASTKPCIKAKMLRKLYFHNKKKFTTAHYFATPQPFTLVYNCYFFHNCLFLTKFVTTFCFKWLISVFDDHFWNHFRTLFALLSSAPMKQTSKWSLSYKNIWSQQTKSRKANGKLEH